MGGADKCIANLRRVQAELSLGGGEALKEWCEDTMKEAQDTYCPVNTGALRKSGKIEKIKTSDDGIIYRLLFTESYASTVHETPAAYKNGKQWKFLQTPLNLRSSELLKGIEAKMSKKV